VKNDYLRNPLSHGESIPKRRFRLAERSIPHNWGEAMSIDVRFLASSSVSALVAAQAVMEEKPLVDPQLCELMADPAKLLASELSSLGIPQSDFFAHAIPLAAGIENNRELVQVAVTKLVGRERALGVRDALAGRIADVEGAFRTAVPRAAEELVQRGQPLKQAWGARGPGLIARLQDFLGAEALVDRADVLLVFPLLGGDGTAYLPYNKATIEAVLADPHLDLPEAVRLGWLLAQLHFELPMFSERVPRDRLPLVAKVATLPAVLAAAEFVQWTAADTASLEQAAKAWGVAPGNESEVVNTAQDWWRVFTTSHPTLDVALAALNKMLP